MTLLMSDPIKSGTERQVSVDFGSGVNSGVTFSVTSSAPDPVLLAVSAGGLVTVLPAGAGISSAVQNYVVASHAGFDPQAIAFQVVPASVDISALAAGLSVSVGPLQPAPTGTLTVDTSIHGLIRAAWTGVDTTAAVPGIANPAAAAPTQVVLKLHRLSDGTDFSMTRNVDPSTGLIDGVLSVLGYAEPIADRDKMEINYFDPNAEQGLGIPEGEYVASVHTQRTVDATQNFETFTSQPWAVSDRFTLTWQSTSARFMEITSVSADNTPGGPGVDVTWTSAGDDIASCTRDYYVRLQGQAFPAGAPTVPVKATRTGAGPHRLTITDFTPAPGQDPPGQGSYSPIAAGTTITALVFFSDLSVQQVNGNFFAYDG
jgi:hypothetical protein